MTIGRQKTCALEQIKICTKLPMLMRDSSVAIVFNVHYVPLVIKKIIQLPYD